MSVDLGVESSETYDSEINVRISWLWYRGVEVRLGDEVNGFLAETVASVADILPWLQEAIAHCYLVSSYAQSLDADVRARTARRLFQPPATNARVRCLHSHTTPQE